MDPSVQVIAGEPRKLKPRWNPERILEPLDLLPMRCMGTGQVDQAWLQEFAMRIGRKTEVVCDPETGEPGPYLRWLCVFRLICERLNSEASLPEQRWKVADDWQPARSISCAQFDAALHQALQRRAAEMDSAEARKDWLRGPFYHGDLANLWQDAAHYLNDEQPIFSALDQCLHDIRQSDGLDPLPLRQVLCQRVLRPGEPLCGEAIERFASWMEGNPTPNVDDLSRLHADVFLVGPPGSKRATLLEQVISHMLRSPEQIEDDTTPLINVWSTGGFVGLRALASSACIEVKKAANGLPRASRPAMIYLPLNRITTERDNRRPLRRDVVSTLCQWLGLPDGRPDESASAHYARQLRDLQRELTRRRLILILDGVEISSPPFGAVVDLIRATDWPNFIRTLIQPDDDELTRNGGRYMSRFLVLSNRRMDSLTAWMPGALPLPLDPVHSAAEALDLVLNRGTVTTLRRELEDRCQELWTSPYARPDCRPDERSLHLLYKLTGETAEAVVAESGGVPEESDMALASCADDAGCRWASDRRSRPWDQIQRTHWRQLVLRAWLHEPHRRRKVGIWDVPAATVALQFIALSFNGMRLETLDRALTRFAAKTAEPEMGKAAEDFRDLLLKPGHASQFKEHYKVFVDKYVDADLEEVPDQLRWFELRANPIADAFLQAAGAAEILEMRDESCRELFISDMLSSGAAMLERFRLMSEILSDESLTQATAQVRRAGSSGAENALALRRFLQAIAHGLHSLDITTLDPRLQAKNSTHSIVTLGGALPEDSYRRFIYLYELIYRRCVENVPGWIFARGLVRDDVRSALLSIFVNPGWARHVMCELHARSADDRGMDTFGAFGAPSSRGFRNAFDGAQPHLRGAVGIDLFNALIHSALRSGLHLGYARSAEELAAELAAVDPHKRAMHERAGGAESWAFDFTKVAIDALQASGAPFEDVIGRCRETLAGMGTHLPWPGVLNLGELFEEHGWDKEEFESKALRPIAADCCPSGRSQRELERIGDILFRMGEALATRADWGEGGQEFDVTIINYCNAYAVFWIGDRVRAQAATRDESSVAWPAVSSRAMRYYIRVALKVAKLAARRAGSSEPTRRVSDADVARKFFAHARSRIDVYSRHLFRLPAERIQIQLLLAAAARVRASMAQRMRWQADESDMVLRSLAASLEYLEDARRLMLNMEFSSGALRRFMLERIKTHAKLGSAPEVPEGERRAFSSLAQRDLATLTRLCSSSDYWKGILSRLRVPSS